MEDELNINTKPNIKYDADFIFISGLLKNLNVINRSQ